MKKNGFTLIELLIVITILAILVGGALPFAQQYIEDSRISRAKQDLDEIRNALVRYETDQFKPYDETTLDRLIGPYLSKGMADPWGSAYIVAPEESKCYSIGPDRVDYSGDEIEVTFRPPLAVSRVFWEDSNRSSVVDTGDRLLIKFTRPIRRTTGDGPQMDVSDFYFSNGAPGGNFLDAEFSNYSMMAKLRLDFAGATPFKTGLDTIGVTINNTIVDGSGQECKSEQPVLIKAR